MKRSLMWMLVALVVALVAQQGTAQIFRSANDPDLVTVTITAPTTDGTFDAGTASTLSTLAGTASSRTSITSCNWENNQGTLSGAASGTTSWSVSSIALTVGTNRILVSCTNAIGLTGYATLSVTRSEDGGGGGGVAEPYCTNVVDGSMLLCEDFEAATLHENVNVGSGSPTWGPWYDSTGFEGSRGWNSYWTNKYGSTNSGCAWGQGEPASPTLGQTCNFATCFAAEWRADNLWQGNHTACIDIVRNGEFDDEISSLGSGPSNASGGGNGVFRGTQTMAHRIAAGSTAGIGTTKSLGASHRTFGITMAVAYAANSQTAGIWNHPWKHNEWGPTDDGIFLFHNQGSLQATDPFQHFAFAQGKEAQCNTALAGATIRRGLVECNSVAFQFRPTTAHYTQSTDWPLGTWACVRGYYQNWGLTNTTVQIWFNSTLIIDFDMSTAFADASSGYSWLRWNNYANANQGQGETPTTATTYRYEDNIHIRSGAPVSCEQIGF